MMTADNLTFGPRSPGGLVPAEVLGAGMGGFLLLFCETAKQPAVRDALGELREVHFGFEPEGSKIIYVGG